jgi:hypothetical protein
VPVPLKEVTLQVQPDVYDERNTPTSRLQVLRVVGVSNGAASAGHKVNSEQRSRSVSLRGSCLNGCAVHATRASEAPRARCVSHAYLSVVQHNGQGRNCQPWVSVVLATDRSCKS